MTRLIEIYVFFFILHIPIISNAQWSSITGVGSTYGYVRLDSTLFAATTNGVAKSTNDGSSWNTLNAGITLCIAVYKNQLFAGLNEYGVVRSIDRGSSWTSVNSGLPNNNRVYSIGTSDSLLFAGLEINGIYRSSNSGDYWSVVNNGLPYPVSVSAILDVNNKIFIGTHENGIYCSTNNGDSWNPSNTGIDNRPTFSFLKLGSMIFAGTASGVFKSTNGGQIWSPIGLSHLSVGSLINYDSTIIAGTSGADVFYSNNFGTSWTSIGGNLPKWRNGSVAALIITTQHLLAGTRYDGMWKRQLSGVITKANEYAIQPLTSTIPFVQVYPNPFNSSTTFTIHIPSTSLISLTVYDIMGREISVVISETLVVGTYTLQWDANGLYSGVYFYRLQADSFSETKKLIILK